MDYLVEAKKFVQLASEASHPEVIQQHLKMASGASRERLRRETARPVRSLAIRTEAQPEVV